jgi:spermidine/putrescine transport system substrate-binding protein
MSITSLILSLGMLFSSTAVGTSAIYAKEMASVPNNKAAVSTLHIYNWADYIGDNVLQEFKDYVKKTDGVDLDVVYETFDTNEIMLSQLETGSASYDLICPSDYMIQRMMAKGLLIPFATGEDRATLYGERSEGWDDNYSSYASHYLQSVFKAITSPIADTGTIGTLGEYARCYMWGTLGILYNPGFSTYTKRGLSLDQVKYDMNDWNSLWKDEYKGTFQIKDSMRDTYSVALMKTYDSLFKSLKEEHDKGTLTDEEYNKKVTIIFNNISHVSEFNALSGEKEVTADGIIDRIQEDLVSLRENSYGLEVDSGKTDITDGKMSGIGMAWSGDAVYSMDTADKLGNTLYYSIPETGGNIWFDGWVIPKTCQNQEYAQKFIDFISDPAIAAENMDYIGYTPSIAGESIIDQVRQWYDPRAYYIYAYDETADDYYYDSDDNPIFCDGTGEKNVDITSDGKTVAHTIDMGSAGNMEGSSFETPVIDGVSSNWESIASTEGWTKVDLSWFFADSYEEGGDYSSIFYSSEIEEIKNPNGDDSIQVGRQFYAQYPPTEKVPSLAVMEDYGDNNSYVLRMWEAVKSGTIPTWVIILLSVEGGIALVAILYFSTKKFMSRRLRHKRKEEAKE